MILRPGIVRRRWDLAIRGRLLGSRAVFVCHENGEKQRPGIDIHWGGGGAFDLLRQAAPRMNMAAGFAELGNQAGVPMTAPEVRRPTFKLRQLMAGVAVAAILFGGLAWAGRNGIWWWAYNAVLGSLYLSPEFAWAASAASLLALVATACDRRVWRLRSLWMLSPIAVPILLLAFGIVFPNAGVTAEWPRFVVEWFPWLLIPLGLVLLGYFRSVSTWIIILGVSTAAAWLSLGSQFMSIMSVTNSWL
jgi:hypothetical protein